MKHLIQLTSEYCHSEGVYKPVGLSINERISYRGELPKCHIKLVIGRYLRPENTSHEFRHQEYITKCLEKMIRPFNYPDNLWNEWVRECEMEEHTELCAAKNAWMYEY